MDEKEFTRRYLDTHLEYSVADFLSNARRGKVKNPEDKNIVYNKDIPGKKIIEKKAFDKRIEDTKHLLLDALAVRKMEILDKEALPMKDLLASIIKTMPSKVEGKQDVNFTFGDMVAQMNIKTSPVQTVDIDKRELKDSDEPV